MYYIVFKVLLCIFAADSRSLFSFRIVRLVLQSRETGIQHTPGRKPLAEGGSGGYRESDIVKAFTCVLLLTFRNFATFKEFVSDMAT